MIEKVAAVVLRGGLLLLCRKRGTDVFISPGGKREAGETDVEALARELREEAGLVLRSAELYGTWIAPSALEPDRDVVVTVYIVEAAGLARPGAEIEELAWVDSGFVRTGVAIGSIFRDEIIPRLLAEGRLRGHRSGTEEGAGAGEKIVVADLDGTLALPGAGLGPEVREALSEMAEDSKVRLVIATSRAPRGARELLGPLADRLDLLCCNGGLHLKGGEVKSSVTLPEKTVAKLVAALAAAGADFWLDYGDRFAVSSAEAAPWMAYPDREVLGAAAARHFVGVVKIAVVDAARWEALIEPCLGAEAAACVHEDGVMDIMAAQASKEEALRRCLGDECRPVVAFGNDLNDQVLLGMADRAFLVGSGLEGLHKAGHVTRIEADDATVGRALRAQLSSGGSAPC